MGSSQAECLWAAQQQLSTLDVDAADMLWISTAPLIPGALPASKARTVLGQEFGTLVFDAFSGFDVNAFAAVCGTLRGGGHLLLLSPPLASWPEYPDPDYRRFIPYPYLPEAVCGRFLKRLVGVLGDNSSPSALALPTDGEERPVCLPALSQADAVSTIVQAQAPVVLSADRGRGKSAALGMAASQLMDTGQRVLLTAPSRATVAAVFKHATTPPRFFAPDDLLHTLPAGDVLLVDEAAAIPLPLLLKMLTHYPRCVFSTTLQGYEGSGRGFALRFQAELSARGAVWQGIQLTRPMRWIDNDPLENLLNRALLLDVDTAPVLEQPGSAGGGVSCHPLDRDDLAADEALLRQVFGLLVTAHYQTRPSDLRQMLDAPDLSIHVLQAQNQVLAVALLSREGGLDAELTAAIHAGQRRPHGHLLAQTLTFHAGIAGAAELKCERIMRLAVHPARQQQGLGRSLLAALVRYAEAQAADYIGVSYALTPGLQAFWTQAGFNLARIGHRKDAASGSRSAVQILGLTAAGKALSAQCISALSS